MKIRVNHSLRYHNTFGIDVRCRCFAEYRTIGDLYQFVCSQPRTMPRLHIGKGSNLLFLNNFDGIVLHSQINDVHQLPCDEPGVVRLRVGGGLVWDTFVNRCIRHGWYGLENLSLIPGTVGAAAVQNIGAYGAEAGEFIEQVDCMNLWTGHRQIFTHDECRYGYRFSAFKTPEMQGQWALLFVTFRLSTSFRPRLDYGGIRNELQRQGISEASLTPEQLRQTIINVRQSKLPDPKVTGNAGSFFKNPVVSREKFEQLASSYPTIPHYDVSPSEVKIPAAWLIEQCGWKGRTQGRVAVHDRQPLVLVNLGGAKGEEVRQLALDIVNDIDNRFGIHLEPEVIFIG